MGIGNITFHNIIFSIVIYLSIATIKFLLPKIPIPITTKSFAIYSQTILFLYFILFYRICIFLAILCKKFVTLLQKNIVFYTCSMRRKVYINRCINIATSKFIKFTYYFINPDIIQTPFAPLLIHWCILFSDIPPMA